MTPLRFLLLFGSLFSLIACASQDESSLSGTPDENTSDHNHRYIVGFVSQTAHDEAKLKRDATLSAWTKLTGADQIEYLRTLTGKAWVIKVTGGSSKTLIESLEKLADIQYVEQDQIIRIDPIETQPAPGSPRIY